MSTANFITKEELADYDYKRIEDSYIPQIKEKAFILPLLYLKSLISVVLVSIIIVLFFFLDLKLNIDPVEYVRLNWSK